MVRFIASYTYLTDFYFFPFYFNLPHPPYIHCYEALASSASTHLLAPSRSVTTLAAFSVKSLFQFASLLRVAASPTMTRPCLARVIPTLMRFYCLTKLPTVVRTIETKTKSNSLPCEESIDKTWSSVSLSAKCSAIAFFYAL